MRRKGFFKAFAVLAIVLTAIAAIATPAQAEWRKGSKGWWYSYGSRGSYYTGLNSIGGKYYYFDSSGWMKTGWINTSGDWYYFHPNTGAAVVGWQKIKGLWYYFGSYGAMRIGKQYIGDKTYYLRDSGSMRTNWYKDSNGEYYWLGIDGAVKYGWQKVNGKWYYLDPYSGIMQTGWKELNGIQYYLDSSGAMATGWRKINKEWYYFDASGAMRTGWLTTGSGTYYLSTSYSTKGEMQTGLQKIGNDYYYFDSTSGRMAKNTTINGERYGSNGKRIHWLVGTWTGTQLTAQSDYPYTCRGGESKTPVVTIKSFDSETMRAKADIKVLIHNHGELSKNMATATGDVYHTFKNVTLALPGYDGDVSTNNSYYSDVYTGMYGDYSVEIGMKFRSNRTFDIRVGSLAFSYGGDEYEMKK
ncbi:MAG: N-acetylmuramoyl-L-alanine amidase family protein [Eggerthellaceae bacterium]|nr:N-acetylmuramoyl-L-alanine amidase family protein [Eggerthellaceae bacterium]